MMHPDGVDKAQSNCCKSNCIFKSLLLSIVSTYPQALNPQQTVLAQPTQAPPLPHLPMTPLDRTPTLCKQATFTAIPVDPWRPTLLNPCMALHISMVARRVSPVEGRGVPLSRTTKARWLCWCVRPSCSTHLDVSWGWCRRLRRGFASECGGCRSVWETTIFTCSRGYQTAEVQRQSLGIAKIGGLKGPA